MKVIGSPTQLLLILLGSILSLGLLLSCDSEVFDGNHTSQPTENELYLDVTTTLLGQQPQNYLGKKVHFTDTIDDKTQEFILIDNFKCWVSQENLEFLTYMHPGDGVSIDGTFEGLVDGVFIVSNCKIGFFCDFDQYGG